MKIPKKLKIGGIVYKVDCLKELEGLNGSCDYQTNTIKICKELPQNQKEQTLIHEILHAINQEFGDKDEFSHLLLESLSVSLYQVLKDNKLKF